MSYNKRTWLNPENSPSTGNVVCFDGMCKDWDKQEWRNTFISISDCHNAARLHIGPEDTVDDFLFKLKTLRSEIADFIEYLENK